MVVFLHSFGTEPANTLAKAVRTAVAQLRTPGAHALRDDIQQRTP